VSEVSLYVDGFVGVMHRRRGGAATLNNEGHNLSSRAKLKRLPLVPRRPSPA
jgi:IS1 family transposase